MVIYTLRASYHLQILGQVDGGTNGASVKDMTQIEASGENIHAMKHFFFKKILCIYF